MNSPLRRALILNLEADNNRIRQLLDFLDTVEDAVDRSRVRRGIQPELRRNGMFGPILRDLQRWKLNGNAGFYRLRQQQYQNLINIIGRFSAALTNPDLNAQQIENLKNTAKSLILKQIHTINIMLKYDAANHAEIIPAGFVEILYNFLEIPIHDIIDVPDQPYVEEISNQSENSIEMPNSESDNVNENNIPILHHENNNIVQLMAHFNNPHLFVRDLLPQHLYEQLNQRPGLEQAIYTLLRRSINSDVEYWQVERDDNDDNNVFFKEIIYRILNSVQHLNLHDGLANNPQQQQYYITIEDDQESNSYHISAERLFPLLTLLGERLRNNGLVAQQQARPGSDVENTVVRAIPAAKRIRFGNVNTIYQIQDNHEIINPGNIAHRSASHPMYNLNNRQNPYGSIRAILNLRNQGAIDRYIQRIENAPHRSLMRNNYVNQFHHLPNIAINLNNNNRGQIRRRQRHHPRQGNFFPFFNQTNYDLHRYQIISKPRELELAMFDDCCLLYAMRMSGLLKETELTEMDCNIITRQVKPAKMASFLTQHNIQITLKTIREPWLEARINNEKPLPSNKFITQTFGVGDRNINVFLLCGHFILDEETPYKKYAFEHRDDIIKLFHSTYDTVRAKKDPNGTVYCNNDVITRIDSNNYPHRDLKRKGMMSSELITELYIQYKQGIPGIFKPIRFDDVSCLNSPVFKDMHKKRRNVEILERLLKYPIEQIQREECLTLEYSKDSIRRLIPPEQKLGQRGRQRIRLEDTLQLRVFYADFESCTSDDNGLYLEAHIPFMCCIKESNTENKATFTGVDCGKKILDWILQQCTNSNVLPLVYFHNLSYDINFIMKYGIQSAVNRNSLILQSDFEYNGQRIRFKDSYGLLSMPLRSMARSFKIELEKEIFPYTYYSPNRVAANEGDIEDVFELEPEWTETDKQQFIQNLDNMNETDHNHFNMLKYAQFYCERDVDVLQRCIDIFHEQVQQSFNIDCHRVISISSIADKYLRRTVYYPFGQMYTYSNHIRDFLLDAVHGGRVMCARNERHHFIAQDYEHGLWDLDAVSLYPSAMSCLYTVGGAPEVLQLEELNYEYLQSSLDITAYVVEIYITRIQKPRDFPLVIEKDPSTGKITYTNTPPVRMTVCDIELQDLVEFQGIEFHIIRGLKWTGPRDYTIQSVVRDLFEKRAEYKKQKNPLENSYKLLLNSIYGKTIQKAIDHEYRYYRPLDNPEAFKTWVTNHSNFIESISCLKDSDIVRIKQVKPINKHFNNTLLGVQILAMSKRLMNRVMCLADDLHLDVYYQDTDSMHIRRDHVPLLERAFFEKYHRVLRGNDLCQYHPDFDPISAGTTPEEVVATESYFLGKKCYIDRLSDGRGHIGFHIRMKGVSQKSIEHTAQGDLLALYKRLYDGETITFDLCCDGQVKFDNAKDGNVRTKNFFERAVKATAETELFPFEERWDMDEAINLLIENK